MNKLNYKISIIFLKENLNHFEKLERDIDNDKQFRSLVYETPQELFQFSKNRKIDILIADFNLWEHENEEQKLSFSRMHNDLILILITNNEISHVEYNEVNKNFIKILLKEPLLENELRSSIDTANKILKILSKNRKNELLFANNRYEEILENISYTDVKKNTDDEKLYFKEILDANKRMLHKFSFFLNDINHTNNKIIANLLEKELPEILKIKKFSIFIIGKDLSSLKLFSSKNFHGDTNLKIPLNETIDKNIMFDSLYLRKSIYLCDFQKSEFENKYKNNYSTSDCLCIPLVTGKKIIGVANFNESQFDFFTKHQTEIIQIFASYFSVYANRNILGDF